MSGHDHEEQDTICAWCTPGLPGNHGICERHAREMRRELARWAPLGKHGAREPIGVLYTDPEHPVERGETRHYGGHRPDQVRFSLLALGVLAGALVCGLLVGAGAAVWEWVMRGGGM